MKGQSRQLGPRSLIRFLEAPTWAQEEAKAREDFLHSFAEFQGVYKELSKGDALEKFSDSDFAGTVVAELKGLGFQYVTVDVEGYRPGST